MYLAILRVIASMLRREHEVEGGRVGSWCGSKRGAAVRGELRYKYNLGHSNGLSVAPLGNL